MNSIFYEDGGVFKTAHILDATEHSLQIEDQRGKRSKIKTKYVWLYFDDSLENDDFLIQAQAIAQTIDIDFLWSCCDQDEFTFEVLAQQYFGEKLRLVEKAATALAISLAPMYFYKKGRGVFKAAPAASLQAALAAQAKQALEIEQIKQWKSELLLGEIPAHFAPIMAMLLYQPDKNSAAFKALAQAAAELHMTPHQLLQKNGAIPDIEAYFLTDFTKRIFPNGIAFPPYPAIQLPLDLPQAPVQAFSIDDSTTIEIDDALSLLPLPNGNYQVGIHIAVPTLGILPGSPLDQQILERLSTIYIPGQKITMLPKEVIVCFSLDSGKPVPALSLYAEFTPQFKAVSYRTALEYVVVADNLRIETLNTVFNENTVLENEAASYPYKKELMWLWQCACQLEQARTNSVATTTASSARVDYNFYIEQLEKGTKKVSIIARNRESPINKLVAEFMILANSHWASILTEANIAAIYRAQNNGKIRMTLAPSPHTGLGVMQYAWFTSPLRRAIDFVNQQQLIAHTLGLKTRFIPNDTNLFTIMATFETASSAYHDFQHKMERYWCLRYLEQENIIEFTATIIKENLARCDILPLYLRVAGLTDMPVGKSVLLQRTALDYLNLNLECRVLSYV